MSVCGNNEDDAPSEEAGAPLRAIYEQKAVSKLVRVLTVLAYLLSVSLAAILLSVYYICVWKSPVMSATNDTKGEVSARRDPYHFTQEVSQPHQYLGGSNTKLNATASTKPASTTTASTVTSTSTASVATSTSVVNSTSTIGVFNSTRPPDLSTDYNTNQDNATDTISIYNETYAT